MRESDWVYGRMIYPMFTNPVSVFLSFMVLKKREIASFWSMFVDQVTSRSKVSTLSELNCLKTKQESVEEEEARSELFFM
jgi:hypothetical protein